MKALSHVFLFAVLIFFSAGRPAASQLVDDAEIERDVAWALQTDSYIGGDFVRVRVRNGIVYLSGHVSTLWERRRAEWLAARVNGVLAVENNLTYSIFPNLDPRI
jgi:osmotically-inducible protein OsmY